MDYAILRPNSQQHRNYAILEEKIRLVGEAYYYLCFLGKAINQYEEGWHHEKKNFSDYLQRLNARIKAIFQETGELPFKVCVLSHDLNPSPHLDTFKRLSSLDYEPPTELLEILADLKALWAFWINCRPTKMYSLSPPIEVSEDGLGLALARLMRRQGEWQTLAKEPMNREISRTKLVTAAKKFMIQIKKEQIYKIYQQHKRTNQLRKMTLHAVALKKKIYKNFHWNG